MGVCVVEVVRAGVVGSITGGFYYEPQHSLYCNTVHLYLYLLLLAAPVTLYLYFPPCVIGWWLYCIFISILFTAIKFVNYALHQTYDTTECIVVPPDDAAPLEKRRPPKDARDEDDLEMQVMNGSRTANNHTSDNESLNSKYFPVTANRNIDFKVDVHRKNSTGSSSDSAEDRLPTKSVLKVMKSRKEELSHRYDREGGTQNSSQPSTSESLPGPSGTRSRIHSKQNSQEISVTIEEIRDTIQIEVCSENEDSLTVNIDDDDAPEDPLQSVKGKNRKSSWRVTKSGQIVRSDSCDNSELSIDDFQLSPTKKMSDSSLQYSCGRYNGDNCTKSTAALSRPTKSALASEMRRNSAISGTRFTVSAANKSGRRHSNVTETGLGFLPTGSVELGAYMLEKSTGDIGSKHKTDVEMRTPGVRRIKSAALEIGCPLPSISNLSPHPNSAETIGGRALKNPKSAILPPPSKSLMRNPHLNLWPENATSSTEANSLPYMNYGSEIVYPIAEISDEMQTSQCQESDLESLSSRCNSDYEDDNVMSLRQLRGFDSDFRPNEANSSDTEYENNGSRSPLLDRSDCLDNVKIVKSKCDKSDMEHKRQYNSKRLSKNNSFSVDIKNSDRLKCDRTRRLPKNNSFNATPSTVGEATFVDEQIGTCDDVDSIKYENSRIIGDSDNTISKHVKQEKILIEFSDGNSVSSKDLLIEKSSVDSSDCIVTELKKESILKNEAIKRIDQDISNSSGSLEMQDARQEVATEASDISEHKILSYQSKDKSEEFDSKIQSDENSLYGINLLFEEKTDDEEKSKDSEEHPQIIENITKIETDNGDNVDSNVSVSQKNLGAIPKQLKNVNRARTSSLKENKRKEKHNTKDKQLDLEFQIKEDQDTVEAHSALVQGLQSLFAASNSNTVVVPPLNYDMRRKGSNRYMMEIGNTVMKPRKKSADETTQPNASTIIPTSMPLLTAFLNSKPDPPQLNSTEDPQPSCSSNRTSENFTEGIRTRPLLDRNHRNRVKKIKRSTRQRNVEQAKSTPERNPDDKKTENREGSLSNVHFATSFEDTSDGAIHCFLDENDTLMSYTFDKNSTGLAKTVTNRIELSKNNNNNNNERQTDTAVIASSSISISSEVETSKSKLAEVIEQGTINGSICNSSSNQGSNNPLLSSNNNSTTMLPVAQPNSRQKAFYGIEQNGQRRNPVALNDSLARRLELYPTNMPLNFLLNTTSNQNDQNSPGTLLMPVTNQNFEQWDCNDVRKKLQIGADQLENSEESQPKTYYKFNLFKCWQIKVTMDRLKLMALLDRNLTIFETILSIILGIMVSMFGSYILYIGFYKDLYAFWFCFIIASSQYSLFKSVQPDSASPIHGFNRMVAFSRPVYFCVCSAILCIIHLNLKSYTENTDHHRMKRETEEPFTLYGISLDTKTSLEVAESVLSNFILCFPIIFSLGLFPQVNTFSMYLFEQIDMHIFGGNATASLSASIYCVFRSLAAIGVLYGFAFGGLTESKGSQHILFSMFCALLIPISYHLSRSASDYTIVWNIIKSHLIPADLYSIHSASNSNLEIEKQSAESKSESKISKSKENSESNISKPPSIGSSTSKINFSSETNISKAPKRSQTSMSSSVASLKNDSMKMGVNLNSSDSIKTDNQADDTKDEVKSKTGSEDSNESDVEDPLPKKLQEAVNGRLKNDVIVCCFMAIFIFGIHCTTVFSILQPELNMVVWSISGLLGWILHYLVPQLRKQLPWLWLSSPILRSREHFQFEVYEPAKVMWFEKVYVYLCFIERNILFPIVFISAVTQDAPNIIEKFGPGLGTLIICICALKGVRSAYSDPDSQYLILLFAILLFRLDYQWATESFLIDYFIMAIIFHKMYEFLLKIQFVVTYIAPWQITWGSAFHAFAQPFSVPHSAMLFLQAAISALLSTPLNPILGSAIFMSSYVRPVKFWERDYNTKRVDQSNTRLSSQLERNLGSDDNNLNSIFYEHLTRSLQHYLCGDLMLGRWGQVQQGDCFVLASDYLNCLVHIVEMGNGLVSFQLRGLEFRGTYCQQREVEAISEEPKDNEGCCCCVVGRLPRMLSVNAMFSLRWLAWQLSTARYVLEGYSITDNSAVSILQVFDLRKVLITYYVKSIIFYTIQSPKLEEWLTSASILEALKPTLDRNFIDLDPIFNPSLDEDFDFRASGVTRASFCLIYHEWITHCAMRREDLFKQKGEKLIAKDSPLVSLCFGLSLVGRRSLVAASHNTVTSVEFFLYGLHSLFKGDFRITCVRDEWVFSDMSLLHSVLAPAVRMALKLHQDHFTFPEEYCSCPILYSAIKCNIACLVICHEASPTWRNNVLRGAPQLLSLRHVMDDGSDEYKIIMLNKKFLSFRVIKLNRECVRGLWAGQQQELIYLRNRNPERGSIQNARQALRNIINSSCDQPIGYPIYVSPLTTSYAETNQQLTSLLGGSLKLSTIKNFAIDTWRKMKRRCGEGCSSGSGSNAIECGISTTNTHLNQTPHHTLDLSRASLAGTRGSLASVGKPGSSTLASIAGFLSSREQPLAPGSLQSHPDLGMTLQRRLLWNETDNSYSTIRENSESNKSDLPPEREASQYEIGRSRSSLSNMSYPQRFMPGASTYGREYRDPRQWASIRERARDSARRLKRDRERERLRPSSFRILNGQDKESDDNSYPPVQSEGYEMNPIKPLKEKDGKPSTSRESRKSENRNTSKVTATTTNFPTPESSAEDLSLNSAGDNCQIIANRNANFKPSSEKRRGSDQASLSCKELTVKYYNNSERNIDNLSQKEVYLRGIESSSEHSVLKKSGESTPKDLAKASKDLRHDRESYRELSGKYSELSKKEAGLRIADDDHSIRKPVLNIDSSRTELKSRITVGCKVVIVDASGVYDCINLGRRIDVTWPSQYQRLRGGRNYWGTWVPEDGMSGQVVHRWTPNHKRVLFRSHVDKTILLIEIDDKFVPIAENCVQDLGDEV